MSAACVIVNPIAGRRGTSRRVSGIRNSFVRVGITDVRATQRSGDEALLALAALESGCSRIAVVGGDGTCSQVANAILYAGAKCAVTVVPCGTGNDFAKTLGVDRYTPEQIADLVVSGRETCIDVGFAAGHYFLNSCGFGFDAAVLEATRRMRFLKGDAVYIYAALRQLVSYRGIEVATTALSQVKRGSMLMVTVSNGRYLGGAFKIAPCASVFDGKLDACFIGESTVLERVRLFARAMRGTHLGMPSVTSATVEQLTLSFAANPSIEMDGELRVAQSRTIEMRCVPRALAVIAAPGALA